MKSMKTENLNLFLISLASLFLVKIPLSNISTK